jgi:hypothetical protein
MAGSLVVRLACFAVVLGTPARLVYNCGMHNLPLIQGSHVCLLVDDVGVNVHHYSMRELTERFG